MAISIYSEMQIGVEGTAGRGRIKACCPPCPGGDGEKTPGAWLAINPLEPVCPWSGHFQEGVQQICSPDNTTGLDGGLCGKDAYARAKACLNYLCCWQQYTGLGLVEK